MKKAKKKVSQQLKFKQSNRDQMMLLPPNIGELLPDWHPVRFVDELVDRMDTSEILATYKSGGTSIYPPKLLLKILFFGYLDRTYSGRDLEKACYETIPYLWLCGDLRPDHVTICNFRSGKLKNKIKDLFAQVLREIYDKGLIELKNQTTDGTTIEAVSNRYQYVWRKNTERYKDAKEAKILSILAEIDEHIAEEGTIIESANSSEEQSLQTNPLEKNSSQENSSQANPLEKNSSKENPPQTNPLEEKPLKEQSSKITSSEVADKVAQLSEVKIEDKKAQRKLNSKLKKLKEAGEKLAKYENQLDILGKRNSYSKTDHDATFMRLKEDHNGTGQPKPAYNIQIDGENEYITNFTMHQNPNDATNYIAHTDDGLAMFESVGLPGYETSNADSIYGTEQNYEYHKEKDITSYLQFPSFYAERKGKFAKKTFDSRNWYFNASDDYLVCVMGQHLHYVRSYVRTSKSGFESDIRVYEASSCATCPLAGSCLSKAKASSTADPFSRKRSVHRNANLENHLNEARNNLSSSKGKAFRKKRGSEIETHFGQLKGNRRFRRLTHSTIKKVEVEVGLHFTAQNIKKLYQTLWLGGISLLKWLEHKMYLTKKSSKTEKTSPKPSFFANCLTEGLRSCLSFFKKLVYPQPPRRTLLSIGRVVVAF